MKMTPWEIKGKEFGNCNCDYGCPCQFNAPPTYGNCEAVVGFIIDEGYYGDISLDNLTAAMIVWWPGPVHEGNGKMQIIVHENADKAQKSSIEKIFFGEDTEPMTTMWSVYSAMCPTKLQTLTKPISLNIDVEGRTGSISVPDVFETIGKPITNPITGDEHRVRIDIPEGFEFEIAEIGSASTEAKGEIKMSLTNSYGQFASIHLNNNGIVRSTT